MTLYQFKYYRLWKVLAAKGLILILLASIWPQYGEAPEIKHLDKLLHFLVYTIASFYINQIYHNLLFKKVTIYLFLYSGFIEFLQGLTVTRSAEATDLVANLFGIFLGFYLSKKINILERVDKLIRQV